MPRATRLILVGRYDITTAAQGEWADRERIQTARDPFDPYSGISGDHPARIVPREEARDGD